VIGVRFCSRKAALNSAFADLGISRFCIQQGLGGPFLGESHLDDSFGALAVNFSWPSGLAASVEYPLASRYSFDRPRVLSFGIQFGTQFGMPFGESFLILRYAIR